MLIAGAICFGLLIGFVTYRTLIRSTATASISDLAGVIGAVGGGAITGIVAPGTELFGYYACALLGGFFIYGILTWVQNRQGFAAVMGRNETDVAKSPLNSA